MFRQLIQLLLISESVCLSGVHALGFSQPKVLQPSDMQPPCALINIVELTDDVVSGGLIIVDRNGSKLRFSYMESGIYFGQENENKVKSNPGSSEEQILLKIFKEWYAKNDDPDLDARKKAFGPDEGVIKQRWFDLHAVRHFIVVLGYRCKTKLEHPEWNTSN